MNKLKLTIGLGLSLLSTEIYGQEIKDTLETRKRSEIEKSIISETKYNVGDTINCGKSYEIDTDYGNFIVNKYIIVGKGIHYKVQKQIDKKRIECDLSEIDRRDQRVLFD